MDATLNIVIDQLKAPQSPKRRAAAKKLRKIGSPEAGGALLDALLREIQDSRTWETQYQLVMALGECKHREALPHLEVLVGKPFDATMIYLALGDAIVRLTTYGSADVGAVLTFVRSGQNRMLIDGAFRAMAMLRLVPSQEDSKEIIGYASKFSPEDGLRFWVAAASPGWTGSHVAAYLDSCSASTRQDVREAAALARAGKYKTWRPL